MINTLTNHGLEPQAIEQPLDLNIPENKIMLAFYLAAPEVENDRRALNVIVGMRRAKKEGRWMATAPKGYKNVRIDNKPTIVPSDDAKHVIWVFEEINKGVLAPDQIRKAVNKKGFNVSRSYFWTMIRNPLYYGKIFIPAYKDEDAHYVKSVHETLISEELFYNVQDILNGKKRPTISTKQKDELPLRGFLTCSRCGGRLIGSASKGRLKRYFYYHCQPGCKERFRAVDINKETIKKLKEISAMKEALKLYRIIIEKELKKTSEDISDDTQKIRAEIAKNQERIDYAEKMMLDRQIDMAEYRSIKSKYEASIKKLKDEMNEATPDLANYKMYLDFGFNILENAERQYIAGTITPKRQMQCSMLNKKLVFDGKKYRTPCYHEDLELILNRVKDLAENKKGQSRKKRLLSSEVVPTGIEPVSKV